MNLHARWQQAADDYAFENALSTLETMGLIDRLDDLVDRQQRTRELRLLSMPALLTGLLLTHCTISGFTLNGAYRLLAERLSPAAQVRHGLRDDVSLDTVTYRQVQYLYRRFSLCTDPAAATDDADWSRRLRFWTRLQDALVRLRVDGPLATSAPEGTAVVNSARVGRLGDPDAVRRYRRPAMRGQHRVDYPLPGRMVPVRYSAVRPDGTLRSASEQASSTDQSTQDSGDVTVDRGYSGPGVWNSASWRAAYDRQVFRERTFGRLKGDD